MSIRKPLATPPADLSVLIVRRMGANAESSLDGIESPAESASYTTFSGVGTVRGRIRFVAKLGGEDDSGRRCAGVT